MVPDHDCISYRGGDIHKSEGHGKPCPYNNEGDGKEKKGTGETPVLPAIENNRRPVLRQAQHERVAATVL
jgi:hypothetical protein